MTQKFDTELFLFYFFINYDPLIFQKAYEEEKWRNDMNEEMHVDWSQKQLSVLTKELNEYLNKNKYKKRGRET